MNLKKPLDMLNKNFYPTPKPIVRKMVEVANEYRKAHSIGYRDFSVLEPSAGKGDIVEGFCDRYNKPDIYVCEIEPKLQSILSDNKHCTVVGSDFLQLETDLHFDAIVMNPPFSDGMSHFLRAWDLINNGIVICLLNSSNLKQDTRKAQLINSIVSENGYKEELGKCFELSERKTSVEVVMVVVEKTTPDYFKVGDLEGETESFEFKDIGSSTEIEVKDALGSYENRYKATIEQFKKTATEIDKFLNLMQPFVSNYRSKHIGSSEELVFDALMNKNLNKFLKYFRGNAWSMLLRSTGFEGKLTSKVKEGFEEKFKQQKNFAFTKNNMLQLIEVLLLNSESILEQCVLQVFDDLTKYHKDNRIHIEGWKSNDAYKVKQKFILPNMWGYNDWNPYQLQYERKALLYDIDKCICRLTGIRYNTEKFDSEGNEQPYIVTLVDAIKQDEKDCTRNFESTFFKIRTYKKGTIHFTFKEESHWRLFNYKASELRGFPLAAAEKGTSTDVAKHKNG